MSGKRIDDLTDLTLQGLWEAHLKGELAQVDVPDQVTVRAAGVLAEKGYWTWMFQAATRFAAGLFFVKRYARMTPFIVN